MVPFLEWIAGAAVWVLANAVYVDMRKRGVHGFGRFAAFFAGLPLTLLSASLVREGRPPRFGPSYEDDQDLLREVRTDRERRKLREKGE